MLKFSKKNYSPLWPVAKFGSSRATSQNWKEKITMCLGSSRVMGVAGN